MKSLFSALILSAALGTVYGQTRRQVAPPEASALIKYINYPVDYSTGLPNISINLYTLKAGNVTIPLSLSYHAAGLKVNERASVVGLGWKLQGVPEVSRTINGLNDFRIGGFLNNPLKGSNSNDYFLSLYKGLFDEQPDEFYYSLLNSSGKAYGGGVTVPYDNHGIDFSQSNETQMNCIEGDGTRYSLGIYPFFDRTDGDGVGNSGPIVSWKCREIIGRGEADTVKFDYYAPLTRNRYRLREYIEVIDNASNEFGGGARDFNFQRKLLLNGTNFDAVDKYNEDWRTIYPRIYDYSYGGSSQGRYFVTNSNQLEKYGIPYDVGSVYDTFTDSQSFIKTIEAKDVKIVFYNKPNVQQLDSIKVFDKSGGILRSISFAYAWGETHITDDRPSDRNQLTSVMFRDNNGLVIEKYQFEYEPLLYPLGIKRGDPWGYYGKGSVPVPFPQDYVSSVPRQTIQVIQPASNVLTGTPGAYQSNFYPSAVYSVDIGGYGAEGDGHLEEGILKKIMLPTGGSTEFEYEVNKYKEEFTDSLREASGLRVRSIKNYDRGHLLQTQRLYKYGDNEDGYGRAKTINIKDAYYQESQVLYLPVKNPILIIPDGPDIEIQGRPYVLPLFGGTERKRVFYSSPLENLSFANGAPVLYNKVTEYLEEGGQHTGKTEYIYSLNSSGQQTQFENSGIHFPGSNEWIENKLLAKNIYVYRNGQFKVLRKSNYQYTNYISPNSVTFRMPFYSQYPHICYPDEYTDSELISNGLYYPNEMASRVLSSGKLLLKKELDTLMDLNNPSVMVTTQKEYGYLPNETFQPIKVQSSLSNGGGLRTTNNSYRYEQPEQVLETLDNNGSTLLTGATYHQYHPDNSLFKSYTAKLDVPIPLSNFSTVVGADLRYELHEQNDKLNGNTNVNQISVNNKIESIYLYSYSNRYPIAEIKNTDYTTVVSLLGGQSAVNTFAKQINPSKSLVDAFISPLRSGLSNAQVTSYTYKPLVGVTSQTDAKGQTTYYEYDEFQRLKNVKDQNGNIVKNTTYNYKP